MAKYLILFLEILFIMAFIFYAAIFHSSFSVFVFVFFECMYIVLMLINSFLLKKRRHVVVSIVQLFLFALGLFLIVSESSFGGLKENCAKMPCLSEAIFLCASLMMICSLFFLVYENVKNK